MTRNAGGSKPVDAASGERKSKTDLAIEARIKELVATAPPLTPAMKTRLAEIFSINRHYKSRL